MYFIHLIYMRYGTPVRKRIRMRIAHPMYACLRDRERERGRERERERERDEKEINTTKKNK